MLEDTQTNCLCAIQPTLCGQEGHYAGIVSCPDQPVNLSLWFLTAVAKERDLSLKGRHSHGPAPSNQNSPQPLSISPTQDLLQLRQPQSSPPSTPQEVEGSSMQSGHRVGNPLSQTRVFHSGAGRGGFREGKGAGGRRTLHPLPRPSLLAGAVAP